MKFQYYENDIKNPVPVGFITLPRFLETIQNPRPETAQLFVDINLADERGDIATKQALKSKLYYFTPAVVLNGRRKYSHIIRFTGLMVLDFDHINNAEDFKQYLFNEYPFILAAWLSASKKGVRALVKIPVCKNPDEFKARFAAITEVLGIYNGFDAAPKNCVLPLFLSYDRKLLTRADAGEFIAILYPPEPAVVKNYVVTDKTSVIEKITLNNINKITNTGHTILRATSYALGGYVGAGYIDLNHAIKIINEMIDCNAYLRQKSSIYKETAKTMINKGAANPLYLSI